MNLKKRRFLYLFIISFQFLSLMNLNAEKYNNSVGSNSLKWNKIENKNGLNDFEKINWKLYVLDDSDIYNPSDKEDIKSINQADLRNSNNNSIKYQEFTQIEPYLPLNNYLNSGEFIITPQLKSAFSAGAASGAGHQNTSLRFDYGLGENSLLTFYLSESDDPLFNSIGGEIIPNNWASIGFGFKKKLFENKDNKTALSFASSIEYWIVSSGSGNKKSIFNEIDNNKRLDRFENIIYSFSLPFTKTFGENITFALVPGGTYLPDRLGKKNVGKNFYGNNYYLGSALKIKLSQDTNIFGSYTYLLGPGDNYFDENLNFSKKPIYSFGINWDVNPIIGIEAKITNAYGSTPATGLLTIPSDNKPLYFVGWSYKPYLPDTLLNSPREEDFNTSYGGLTVSNALLPKSGESQIELNYDSMGNLFTTYKYSLSNIFQLEILNIGSFKDVNAPPNKDKNIRETYIGEDYFNYRLGGKFLIFSPQKDDIIWLSTRVSLGRNNKTKQGYVFSELIGSYRLNEWIMVNINPKYFFSGVNNLAGMGFSSNLTLLDNLQLIPELNTNFMRDETNYTLALRYIYSSRGSVDFYVSNALGIQDVGQMLKADSNRYGIKLNFIY